MCLNKEKNIFKKILFEIVLQILYECYTSVMHDSKSVGSKEKYIF